MIVTDTPISGAVVLRSEAMRDVRGSFVRTFDAHALAAAGLVTDFVEHSLSVNTTAHTLRGRHLQESPHEETKIVRCVRGRIWDVVADVRPSSPTFGQWYAVELDETAELALYVSAGLAHGFVTLVEDSAVHYLISTPYVPLASSGVRWDDPILGIEWPVAPTVMSDRDRSLPLLSP